MEHFKSDINSRREMEIKYYRGLNKRIETSEINSSASQATMTDRVKMDTYFMNMANTAKNCLRDDNCRRYLSDTMTDQRNKKKKLKDSIHENMHYSRYSSMQPPKSDKVVHYSRMYGPGNVASNFVVDSSKDVAPNFRGGGGGRPSDGGVSQSGDKIHSIPDELKNLNITGGVNISGINPQIR